MKTIEISLKQLTDHIMDMHLQAMRPWQWGQFVLFAEIISGEITIDDSDAARTAQKVADEFLWKMVYGRAG